MVDRWLQRLIVALPDEYYTPRLVFSHGWSVWVTDYAWPVPRGFVSSVEASSDIIQRSTPTERAVFHRLEALFVECSASVLERLQC